MSSLDKRLVALEARARAWPPVGSPAQQAENAAASLHLSLMKFAEDVTRVRYPMRDPSRPQAETVIEARKESARYELVMRQRVRDDEHALLDTLDASDDVGSTLRAWADEGGRLLRWCLVNGKPATGYAVLHNHIIHERAFHARDRVPLWGLWRYRDPERTEDDLARWQRLCRSLVTMVPEP